MKYQKKGLNGAVFENRLRIQNGEDRSQNKGKHSAKAW